MKTAEHDQLMSHRQSKKRVSSIMGIFGSSEETNEEKNIDSTGHVNNNIVIQEAKDTHSQLIVNERLYYATLILVLFEVIKLGIFMFSSYKRKLKKAYKGNESSEK